MDIFKGENLLDFTERFSTEEKCKEYLANYKWEFGYTCQKCGHTKYQERKDFSRTCNKCSHTESATANTMLHNQKFGLRKAFHIIFEVCNSTKGMSASQIARRYSIARGTAHTFLHKIRSAMKSTESQPMTGKVIVDEFVIGGKESEKPGRSYHSKKKKVVMAVELTEENKVKRIYSRHIDNYSAASLNEIFQKHISKDADVLTDEWKSYAKIAKDEDYKIEQLNSKGYSASSFFEIHTMIHQVKSNIRTIYSWVSKKYVQNYLDEIAFRINRSLTKHTIVNNLLKRLVNGRPQSWQTTMKYVPI